MFLVVILFPLFTNAFIHFHHHTNHGHPLSKCNGVEDLLGIQEITSDPEKARAGHDINFHIKGKSLKDVTNPLCRTHARKAYHIINACDSGQLECPMTGGSDWSISSKFHVPGKAEALAGQKIKIQVQCQESTSDSNQWDDKAPMITCIETSVKISLWLEETQSPMTSEDKPATSHSGTSKILTDPKLFAPILGGVVLGFLLSAVIVYWRIKKRSRREVDEIWSATLVQTDIYVDFEEEGTPCEEDGAI